MKRGNLEHLTQDLKKRLVLKKVKKRWVVTGLVLVTGLVSTPVLVSSLAMPVDANLQTPLVSPLVSKPSGIMPLTEVATLRIDQLTDTTQLGGDNVHTKSMTNAEFTAANFTASSSSPLGVTFLDNLSYPSYYSGPQFQNKNAVSLIPATTGVAGSNGNKEGAGVTGAISFNQQIDMTQPWSMVGNFDMNAVNTAGSTPTGPGEFLGLVLSPVQPSQLSGGKGGGGLGIQGLANTTGWGIDFWNESAKNDAGGNSVNSPYFGDTPSVNGTSVRNPGYTLLGSGNREQVVGFRYTDASGALNKPSANDVNRRVMDGSNGAEINGTDNSGTYSNNYRNGGGGTNNQPQIVRPFSISYVYNHNGTGTVSITVNGSNTAGGWSFGDSSGVSKYPSTYTFTRTIPLVSNSMSVGFSATSGGSGGYWAQMGLDLTSFQINLGTGHVTTNYQVIDSSGNVTNPSLISPTIFLANTTDTIGIIGFDGDGPTTADQSNLTWTLSAPTSTNYTQLQGYHLAKVAPVTVLSDNMDTSGTVSNGASQLNLQYQGDTQSAPLTAISTDSQVTVPFTIPSGDSAMTGASNTPIVFATTDTQLAQAGYTYKVSYTEGQTTTSYDTLAAALAAHPNYNHDTTWVNGASISDPTAQSFTVQYTPNPVTVTYGLIASGGQTVDTTKSSQIASDDSLTSGLSIGKVLTSSLASSVTATPDSQTPIFQNQNILANGYHLTGQVSWSKDNGASLTNLPTNALTAGDVSADDKGVLVFEYAKDYQAASVTVNYDNNAQPQSVRNASGLTGEPFSFNLLGIPVAGYHFTSAKAPDGSDLALPLTTISANFDATNNLQANSDSKPQNYLLTASPDSQQLNISYHFPAGHDLTNNLTAAQKMQTGTTGTVFSDVTVPSIAGYTTYINGVASSDNIISGITADNTSNGASQIDNVPQTVSVTYVANDQTITVNYTTPDGETPIPQQIISGKTDGSYDAISITQLSGYTSYVSINGGTPLVMTSVPAGTFGTSGITITVTYAAWQAQVNYFRQQLDSSGSPIGALTALPGANASQSGAAGYDFSSQFGTSTIAQTTALQAMTAIPAGYHVTRHFWSDTPDGTLEDTNLTDMTAWTWDNMTNTATGLVPTYQAAIVYQYTKDVQQANITVTGAPAGQGVTNGSNTLEGMNNVPYTGLTGGTQVVSVPQINGYLATVTDATGKVINLTNSTFTITYDDTNNGAATTDSSPQAYTITYTPRTATVLVTYTYATGTQTSVSSSPSVDTVAYTAPSLPQAVQINTQTNGTYSLSVPAVSGYSWTVTDSNGKTYTSATLPTSFTNDGVNITYTVSYQADLATHAIHYNEASYDTSGNYSFTSNPVPGLTTTSVTGAVGSIQEFGVTSSTISVPSGWSLDPMKAALASLTGDNDHLNGGDTAKRLTFTPGQTDYIVYLARDIQSVQVKFVNDPTHRTTLYQDGRTGQAYTVDTTGFARAGYDYAITDSNGGAVTSISGTYDSTSNSNATSPIYNTGDGDQTPQVYTVTYTPQTQTAILKTDTSDPENPTGMTLQTATGPTDSTIQFNQTDKDLFRSGYNYNVTVSYNNSAGQAITSNYPTLGLALAANSTYNDNPVTTGQADSNPQIFTVSYTPCSQTAILRTDASDPNGAQTLDTQTGVTAQALTFLKSDTDLARAGYAYQIKGPDNQNYTTLAAALAANGTYDQTDNGTSAVDSKPQSFVVTYTALAQTIQLKYVYGEPKNIPVPAADFGGQSVPSQILGVTNGQTYTTDVATSSPTPITTPISVPSIPGYTPNVTKVTPSFSVDSQGNLTQPEITITYNPSPDTATISYVDTSGNSLLPYIGNNPTSTSGYTDSPIMAQVPQALPGYNLQGFKFNSGELNADLSALTDVVYTSGADTLVFVYAPKTDNVVTINYVYSDVDLSPKNGPVPTSDFDVQEPLPATSVTGTTNTTGTAITPPTIAGYTATVSATPDFHIDSQGNLLSPSVTVTYTAIPQKATIAYKLAAIDTSDTSVDTTNLTDMPAELLNGAATTATGVTDQAIGVTPPSIPGYTIYQQTVNGTENPISQASFTTANPDELQVIYAPMQQKATVHYVFQLPTGYNGTYNGIDVTTANGQAVTSVDSSSPLVTQTYTGFTGERNLDISALSSLASGWQLYATSQTISWAINADGSLTKADYYFYVSPITSKVTISYIANDGFDLSTIIKANNESPILTSDAMGGASFVNSGAIAIPGYHFVNYVYAGNTSDTPLSNPNDLAYVSGANALVFNYAPNVQTVDIAYVYDPNNALNGSKTGTVPTNDFMTPAVTSQTKVSNAKGDTVNVPKIQGYTASADTVMPNFAIDSMTGQLVQPKITVTYTANQNNTATIQYVDTAGHDITQYATTAPTKIASGTTDATIATSGAVAIPGYTFDHIEFTTAAGVTNANADLTSLVFTGGGATPDQIKFVYKANAQEVSVHYLYSGGGKNGQAIFATKLLSGLSNQAATTEIALDAPAGYSLVKAGLDAQNAQPVMWTTVNGQLVTPNIYFYYLANVTTATINYQTSDGSQNLNKIVPTGTTTGLVQGQTDALIPASGALDLNGYSFNAMQVNDNASAATTVEAANDLSNKLVFTPNSTVAIPTTITYLYTPNAQKVTVKFVDASGQPLVSATGQAISDVSLTGLTGKTIDYSSLTTDYTGYSLQTDGRQTTPTYDANDQIDQIVYMTYKQEEQSVTVHYIDQASDLDIPNTNPITVSGKTNDLIDYDAVTLNLPGYTLVHDGTNDITRFGTSDQTVNITYQANAQQAIINFKVSQDGGQTWHNLTQTVTLSGKTNESINYAELQTAYPGYKLIDNHQEDSNTTYDTADGIAQVINLYYAPLKQVAVLQTDATDPDITGGAEITATRDGYSFGQLTFTSDDEAKLARKGFTYKVYGPDGVWYDTLANALAANAKYDGTPDNTEVIDTAVPSTQSLALFEPFALSRSVVPTNPSIDPENPGQIAGDNVPQVFTVSYTPMPQSMVVQTINDPAGNQTYPTVTGVTGTDDAGQPIASNSPLFQGSMVLPYVPTITGFYNVNVVDTQLQTTSSGLPNLFRKGYSYVVQAPNGQTYSTLEAATQAVHVFDNDPKSNQIFKVTYTAQMQLARILTDATDPKGAQIIETSQGPSDSNITFQSNASNLKRSGYTYQVKAPDGKVYATLAEALKAVGTYDHNDLTEGLDETPQDFTVTYAPVKQTANLLVDGKVFESVTGDSDSVLNFSATDKDLHKSGYTYQVKAPDGKVYATLAEALKAVGTYDHNDLTDGLDETPQNFEVIYKQNNHQNQSDDKKEGGETKPQNQVSDKGTANDNLGHFGELVEQYGLIGGVMIVIALAIWLGLKKFRKQHDKDDK